MGMVWASVGAENYDVADDFEHGSADQWGSSEGKPISP